MLSLNSRDFYAIAERHVVRMLVLILLLFAALKVIASEVPAWLIQWPR